MQFRNVPSQFIFSPFGWAFGGFRGFSVPASKSLRLPALVLSHQGSLAHTPTSISGALRAKPLPCSSWCWLSTAKSFHWWYDHTHQHVACHYIAVSCCTQFYSSRSADLCEIGACTSAPGALGPGCTFRTPAAHLGHGQAFGRMWSLEVAKTLWNPPTFYVYFPLRNPIEWQRK